MRSQRLCGCAGRLTQFQNLIESTMGLSNALSLYRNLLKLARNLPAAKRVDTIEQIKGGFRDGKNISDPDEIHAMLERARSTIGYLKIVTPRSPATHVQTGKTKTVFGEEGYQRGRAVSNWTGNNMDPDSVKRHQQNLSRAGFKNNAHMKGIF